MKWKRTLKNQTPWISHCYAKITKHTKHKFAQQQKQNKKKKEMEFLCSNLDMSMFCNDDGLMVTIVQTLVWTFKNYIQNGKVCIMMATIDIWIMWP